jgi:nucleoside-diphosphate-sugar epimerase
VSLRLAITGASGFVGRHVVSLATAEGHEVHALVRHESAALELQTSGARVTRGALDERTMREVVDGADALVHLAHVGHETEGATFESVNVAGTRTAVAAAREAGVGRVVMFSGLGVARYGMAPRCTNAYFQSKLAAEVALFRAGLPATVFRPSYIVGPGDGLLRHLLTAFASGRLVRPGDGSYRMQPIAVRDAAAAVVQAASRTAAFTDGRPPHRVIDLVGPEPVSYDVLIRRVAAAAKAEGRAVDFEIVPVPIEQAQSEARARGRADDFDCLVCDEVSDARPLEAFLGRSLLPLDEALAIGVRGTRSA